MNRWRQEMEKLKFNNLKMDTVASYVIEPALECPCIMCSMCNVAVSHSDDVGTIITDVWSHDNSNHRRD